MASSSTPQQPPVEDSVFKATYPHWTWVDLGEHTADPGKNVTLPERISTKELVEKISKGSKLARLMQGTEEKAHDVLVRDFNFPSKISRGGQKIDEPSILTEAWIVMGCSQYKDNRGLVYLDNQQKEPISIETKEWTDRDFDYILSILESPVVGHVERAKDARNAGRIWEFKRTASSITYPYGPNLPVMFVQDKQYGTGIKNDATKLPPTNSRYETFFNIYDGISIMNAFSPKPAKDLGNGTKGRLPVCADWSDVTFQQWAAMHLADKKVKHDKASGGPKATRVHLDLDFPPPNGNNRHEITAFDTGFAAGRVMSRKRAPMQFYAAIEGKERRAMRDFLNYIISWSDSVSEKTVAVILRCLDSRDIFGNLGGKAPVWGSHYTFDMGSWEYHALLGTDIGEQIAMFLGRHKDSSALDHKVISSVTLFATDSRKNVNGQLRFIKWPVIIWKVSPVDPAAVTTARELEQEYFNDNGSHKLDVNGNPVLPFGEGAQIAPEVKIQQNIGQDMPRIWLDTKHLYVSAQTSGNMVYKDQESQGGVAS